MGACPKLERDRQRLAAATDARGKQPRPRLHPTDSPEPKRPITRRARASFVGQGQPRAQAQHGRAVTLDPTRLKTSCQITVQPSPQLPVHVRRGSPADRRRGGVILEDQPSLVRRGATAQDNDHAAVGAGLRTAKIRGWRGQQVHRFFQLATCQNRPWRSSAVTPWDCAGISMPRTRGQNWAPADIAGADSHSIEV